jgi:hypothetical protein
MGRARYFERTRLEYHPENRPPYDVLLGQLGRAALTASAAPWPRRAAEIHPVFTSGDTAGNRRGARSATSGETPRAEGRAGPGSPRGGARVAPRR